MLEKNYQSYRYTSQNGEFVYGVSDNYIDSDSIVIKKTPDGRTYISLWLKIIYEQPAISVQGHEIYQLKSLTFFDCNNRSWSDGYSNSYNKNGEMIIERGLPLNYITKQMQKFNSNFTPEYWMVITPDTIMEKKLNKACALAKQ